MYKETILERADFNLQLLMFVTSEKERRMFIIFFLSSFYQLLSPRFWARTGWARPDHESSDQPALKAALCNAVSLEMDQEEGENVKLFLPTVAAPL